MATNFFLIKERLKQKLAKIFGTRERKHRAIILLTGMALSIIVSLISMRYFQIRDVLHYQPENKLFQTIDHWDNVTSDWRMNQRPMVKGHPRIAILAIDDESISQEGRWPWNRTKIAALIEKAISHGAKILSFDIIFSEEDSASGVKALEELSREAASHKKSANNITEFIKQRISRFDSDQILAETIKRNSSQIVLGNYSQSPDFQLPAFSEICLEAVNSRSYSFQHRNRNEIKISVLDAKHDSMKDLRDLISEHLGPYLNILHFSSAQKWFHERPETSARTDSLLNQNKLKIPAEYLPGLAVFALANDFRNGKVILDEISLAQANQTETQSKSEINTYENVKKTFRTILQSFTTQEKNSLQKSISASSLDYCRRFFTEKDELTDETTFRKLWHQAPEVAEQHQLFSWGEILNEKKAPQKWIGQNINESISKIIREISTHDMPHTDEWNVNIPKIADAAKHSGYFNAIQDKDGNIRKTQLIARQGSFFNPSLALKTFLLDTKSEVSILIHSDSSKPDQSKKITKLTTQSPLTSKPFDIPINSTGMLNINYSGPRFSFPHVSATQLLNDDSEMTLTWRHQTEENGPWIDGQKNKVKKSEFLADKILFVGATAIGIYDLRVTPVDQNFPGVETHANVLSNLMVEHERNNSLNKPNTVLMGFLRRHSSETWLMPVFILALGTLQTSIFVFFGSVISLIATFILVVGVVVVDEFAFFRHGSVVSVLFPLILISSCSLVLSFMKYFGEERKKKNLKEVFEKYVAPSVVDEILSNPEAIALGGKKINMSVMFSDIRDFTQLAESIDPEKLSQILVRYFTPMTDIIFETRGTLDKYIGDAIMAFWGAPLPIPNHAELAASCALQMLRKLKELNAESSSPLERLRIGIGINTGEMNVGNMGSQTIRSYTAIGDSVNIGARLESLTKEYGVSIIVSATTYESIKHRFFCREIDNVLVKGKQIPVTIYELISEKNDALDLELSLQDYNNALQLFKEARFSESAEAFKKISLLNTQDPIPWIYLKRCKTELEKTHE